LTWRTTKFTSSDFGKPSMSPSPVTTTWRRDVTWPDLLQGVGKVLDDDDRLATGVAQLMLELAGGVERIDVDHRVAARRMPNMAIGYCRQLGIISATRAPGASFSSPCR
jgi:hypothetical protein